MEDLVDMNQSPSEEFWNGKRVLVTGHSGFKGSWLTLWLQQLGAEVYGLSIDDRSPRDLYYSAGIANKCLNNFGDIGFEGEWTAGVKDFDPEIVFHLAAQPLVLEGYSNPIRTFQTNVIGTANVLQLCREITSLRSVLIITTDKVYEHSVLHQPFIESDKLGGEDPYSASKAAAEIVTESFAKSYLRSIGVAVSTCRAGNVIGGGDWAKDRLIPDAVRAWESGSHLQVRNLNSVRPWQHVLEPLFGYIVLAERSSLNQALSGAYNFGPSSGAISTVREVLELVRKNLGGLQIMLTEVDALPYENPWLSLDSGKAERLINVASKLSLSDAITWTTDWYRETLEESDPAEICIRQINEFREKQLL